MRGNELLDKLELVDPAYVEAADVPPKRRKNGWIRLAAAAACLCIAVGVGAHLAGRFDWDSDASSHGSTASPAHGFVFNNAIYFPIDFESRERFGISQESMLQITEADIGEWMGTAEVKTYDAQGTVASIELYHYAAFPDTDTICIAVYPGGGKAFFVMDAPVIPEEARVTSDGILEAYHVPESVSELLVQTGSWVTKMTTTDKEQIEAICAILQGKRDMGVAEHERLYARAWYDAYGNTDVYYDEEKQTVVFPSDPNWRSKKITFRDETGTKVSRVEPDKIYEEAYKKAHALWGKNERILIFTTEFGQFYVFYTPSIHAFHTCDGYYPLSEEEVLEMNRLLEIE